MHNIDQIAAIALTTVLAFTLIHRLFTVYQSIFASNWPKARGQIVNTAIREDYEAELRTWEPLVSYTYSVKKREYTSAKIAFGLSPWFWFQANAIVKKFSGSPNVMVSYNPNRPHQAVLMTGIKYFHILDLFFLTGFIWVLSVEIGIF